jgi:hypothetical protein
MKNIKTILNNNFITVEETCRILDISRMTLYRRELNGLIVGVKYGRRKYYSSIEIHNYINSTLSLTIS